MEKTTAFEHFFKENYQRMYYVAVGIVHDSEASKDIVSAAFEHVFLRFNDITPDYRLAYLYSVVRNKCADHFRRISVHDHYAQLYLALNDSCQEPNYLEHQERVAAVYKAIEELPSRNKEILKACIFSGKKYAQIADEHGITENCVKKHVMKAIKIIRTKIVKNNGL